MFSKTISSSRTKSQGILLSIAGYDPTCSAGALLDGLAFRRLGFIGMGILTSITVQNTRKVEKIHCLPSQFLLEQYKTLSKDVSILGMKTGMIGCKEHIEVIGEILSRHPDIPKVIDPVFQSTSGQWLFEKKAIPDYLEKIKGQASLLTPNLNETELITHIKIQSLEDMKKAAKIIFQGYAIPSLIKGGHLKENAVDLLFDGKAFSLFKKKKLGKKVHGTGCFLSSSILCYLAKGLSLEKSCGLAKDFTHKVIKRAISLGVGQDIISL